MIVFYKQHRDFLSEHAVDADKRRYALAEEGARHYIDLDHYSHHPFDSVAVTWDEAVGRFGQDSLTQYGIVPWWVERMYYRLVTAFREQDALRILKLSADIGHYISDAHVPLHACSNYNGQKTGQHGIHGLWESRLPELLAEKEWDFFIGKADYIKNPSPFIWQRVRESAAAADTVLKSEKELSAVFPSDRKFAFEERNGKLLRQYSSAYSTSWNTIMGGMVERRMRQSVFAIASFWYTAWVDAGQPDLTALTPVFLSDEEAMELEVLNRAWRSGDMIGRKEE